MQCVVRIDPRIYQRYREHAELFNATITRTVNAALFDWMETIGDGRKELMVEQFQEEAKRTGLC
jgi:hypothetical protein